MKNAELTMIIHQDKENGWLIGHLEEFPSAISQGRTMDELENNLVDALNLYLDAQKDLLMKEYTNENIIRRPLQYAY